MYINKRNDNKRMVKIKSIILGIFIFVILINMASAISITINIKPSFNVGEQVSFDYTILSNTNQEIQYITSANCPNVPAPLLEIKNTSLIANVPFQETYIYLSSLNDNIEPQNCKAIVSILNPEQREEKNFSIETNPSFEFNALTCKNSNCSEQTKVFVKNENIYFDYTSDVERISAIAILTYPDQTTKQLTFPTSIKAEQIGTYKLKLTATKDGYKTISKEIQFGVIEKEANIGYGFKETIKKINWIWLIILIAGVVVIIGVLVYLIWRRKKKQDVLEQPISNNNT